MKYLNALARPFSRITTRDREDADYKNGPDAACPFLALPPELRLSIYDHLLSPCVSSPTEEQYQYRLPWDWPRNDLNDFVCLALTCSTIRHELKSHFEQHYIRRVRLYFDDIYALWRTREIALMLGQEYMKLRFSLRTYCRAVVGSYLNGPIWPKRFDTEFLMYICDNANINAARHAYCNNSDTNGGTIYTEGRQICPLCRVPICVFYQNGREPIRDRIDDQSSVMVHVTEALQRRDDRPCEYHNYVLVVGGGRLVMRESMYEEMKGTFAALEEIEAWKRFPSRKMRKGFKRANEWRMKREGWEELMHTPDVLKLREAAGRLETIEEKYRTRI
ncbi:hypothetical protein M433DRAFT_151286 [Acidomyces richmondensis BFW]|nr:MAG: hypothetical protein FE78DRAFT_85220 [Acidomyces sp. 'richmondensis']KYG48233.1 hypothetical protein M433DRAFT_151286 [Acidomyces richmondensis BFW]